MSEHYQFGMIGYVFRTWSDWVTLKDFSSGFEDKYVIPKDYHIRHVAKELSLTFFCGRDLGYLCSILSSTRQCLRGGRNSLRFLEDLFRADISV